MAISELTATRPEIFSRFPALITLKPNQPMARAQEPSARKGMLLIGMGWDLPRT